MNRFRLAGSAQARGRRRPSPVEVRRTARAERRTLRGGGGPEGASTGAEPPAVHEDLTSRIAAPHTPGVARGRRGCGPSATAAAMERDNGGGVQSDQRQGKGDGGSKGLC